MSREEPEPMAVDVARVLKIGIALWSVVLVVSLLVPAMHQGDRHWWPWACLAGMVGGSLALLYVRRGRGNAPTSSTRRRSGPG